MSETEYNSLLFRISKRLDDINDLEHILFICRGKLEHQADQDIDNTLSLLRKLEDSNFLGVDYLQLVKDILKAVEEWDLYEKVVKFERTRREYKELLERVINVLEGLNDLERLMCTVCRVRRMPEERKNDVHDVRSLIQVLEDMNFLGIDCLEILREIFTELNNDELLTELAEFQKRRMEDETRERTKAREAAVWSSARAATQRIIGEIRLHCTFRTLGGVLVLVGTGLILRRSSTLKEYFQVFRAVILPAAIELRAISEGSVCFTVQAETSLALEELYERYSTGKLQKDLQEFLVTDDIKELADGEEVVVSVYVDEKEFREALDDLTNLDQEGRNEVEGNQSRYLNEERMAFVQKYLENTEHTGSLTTGASDDGIGSLSAPSDLALEEPGESTIEPCLKDLSEDAMAELTVRLLCDEVLCNQFYHSFGLESRHPQKMFRENENVGKLFPDTPVKLVIDVCRALQLYDLVELLEKAAKPRTLRPALPLNEIAKLPSYSNRPTTFYRKVKILFVGDAEETFDTIRTFFEKICPGSKCSGLKAGYDISRWQSRRRVLLDQRESILLGLKETELGERKIELQKLKDENQKKILEIVEEIKEEKKKIKADISSAFDKSWGEERDDKSTLFVTFQVHKFTSNYPQSYVGYKMYIAHSANTRDWITGIMMEKLTSFPTAPKLVVSPSLDAHEIPELLRVEYKGSEGVVRTILEVLSKRWQTLDLISIIKEAQRTVPKNGGNRITKITDNLSVIPRFQPTPEQS